jgi:starch-binding outer membrane protein, SusD/RagB family
MSNQPSIYLPGYRSGRLPSIAALAATLSLIAVTGCDIDVPDLNNPGIDQLADNPTQVTVGAACTGLLIGNRRNRAQANGYVAQLGILGREAYSFDPADPRFINEMLKGKLAQGSPFGGNFWGGPYANIRLANIVQQVVGRVSDFSPEEMSAILGFSKTIEATDLLEVVSTHDTNGGVIDTDHDVDAPLGPIVGRDQMLAEIARMLDEAASDLAKGGDGFPFSLSSGFRGFDDPSGLVKYNRATRARVAAYQKDYAAASTALAQSFLNAGSVMKPLTVDDLQVGVYHAYSTASGDQVNNLRNPNLYTHPSFALMAQMNGANVDQRVTRKTRVVAGTSSDPMGSLQGLSSDRKYTLYTRNDTPLPIIRNEELLLLRAEARWFGAPSDKTGALEDLNLVRQTSGSLPVLTPTPATDADFISALLYERRYSLAFEGHRLIDVRRFDRVMELPLDKPEHVRNIRYPIPLAECDARPNEPACLLSSQ